MNKPENNMVKIGEGMEFTSEYARDFYFDNFSKVEGVDEIYAGVVPQGYTQQGDLVFHGNVRINGLAKYNAETRLSNIYLFKAAFVSKEQLYLTMGHEFLHAGFWHKGLLQSEIAEHRSIRAWQYAQAKEWDYNMAYYSQWRGSIGQGDYDYQKFSFTNIITHKPW